MTATEIFKTQQARNKNEVHYRINYKTQRMRVVGAGKLADTVRWSFNPYHHSRPCLGSMEVPNFSNNRDYMFYQHTGMVTYAGIEEGVIQGGYPYYVRVGVQYWNEAVERLIPASDLESAKEFCRGLLINY
jgi:hypothetical protein